MSRAAKSTARPLTFTNPNKEYFPSGYTKGEMIRYYLEVAPFMLAHLKDRPVTLIRFPEGVRGESFYEKNAPKHAPDWVKTHPVPRRHHEGHINYILINDAETLAWCANLGAIELHPAEAGMHLVGWLPEGVDDTQIAKRAAQASLDTPALSSYALEPLRRGGLLLGYAAVDETEIRQGIRRLGTVLSSDPSLRSRARF